MNTSAQTGRLITFEGIEGAGKGLQADRLVERLRSRGHSVQIYREPGGTPFGEACRDLVKTPEHKPTDLAELFLMMAARSQLLEERVKPALAAGVWTILDRHVDSVITYQGYARGVSLSLIERLNTEVVGTTLPIRTFLLDLPVAKMRERIASRGEPEDRLEQEKEAFFEVVREGYLSQARKHHERIVTIDASLSPDVIEEAIWAQIESLIAEDDSHQR